MLRGFAIITASVILAASPIKNPSARFGRNDNAFAIVHFFLVFFFGFMSMLILVLAFIAAQRVAVAALSLRVEFFAR